MHQATQEFLNWIDSLTEQDKTYVMDMHMYLTNLGIKPRKYNNENFQYWYKGNRVMYLRKNTWRNTPLDIAVQYRLKGNNNGIDSFIKACSGEPDENELIKYTMNNACCCDRGNGKCNYERCGGFWVEYAGIKRKLAFCHNDITKWKAPKVKLNYTDNDLLFLKRLVDIRIKQISQNN